MDYFEFINNIYNSFINIITELQIQGNDIINKYGGFYNFSHLKRP